MKKILLATFLILIVANTYSVIFAATSDDLLAQADALTQQALTKPAGSPEQQVLLNQANALRAQAVNYKKDELNTQAAELEKKAKQAFDEGRGADYEKYSKEAAALRAQAQALGTGGDTTVAPADAAKTAAGKTEPQILPQYKLIVPIPGFQPGNEANPLKYIVALYNVAIAAGGLIAMGIIVFAGLKWATSAGNQSAISEAKDLLLHAVYGLAMLMGATLILYTIGGESFTKLTLPTLTKVPSTSFDFGQAAEQQRLLEERYNQSLKDREQAVQDLAAAEKEYAEKKAKGIATIDDEIKLQEAVVKDKQTRVNAYRDIEFLAANRSQKAQQYLSAILNGKENEIREAYEQYTGVGGIVDFFTENAAEVAQKTFDTEIERYNHARANTRAAEKALADAQKVLDDLYSQKAAGGKGKL